MATKQRMTPDQREEWMDRLRVSTATLDIKREEAEQAEMEWRALINNAFDAGLSVTPIMEATGRSLGRIYQIKRGTRR